MSTSCLHDFGATNRARVDQAIRSIQDGTPVILVDDEHRENEGDLVIAAEKVTSENINFMIRNGSGIVCVALTEERTKELEFPLMVSDHEAKAPFAARFTVSIEARFGVSTGVSASDRATTILATTKDDAKPTDFARPGHVFPLIAKKGGLRERQGHTEGSIALVQSAGFKPAAAICELMNPDGSMARLFDAIDFARKHNLTILSIKDLVGVLNVD